MAHPCLAYPVVVVVVVAVHPFQALAEVEGYLALDNNTFGYF